jgi:hypothetical protein
MLNEYQQSTQKNRSPVDAPPHKKNDYLMQNGFNNCDHISVI